MTSDDPIDELDELDAYLAKQGNVSGALVVEGSADSMVAEMLAQGWTVDEVEMVGGKRVRLLSPPSRSSRV